MIEHSDSSLSMRKKCEALGVARSRMYYKRQDESQSSIDIMNEMREVHTRTPFYGYRRMQVELEKNGYYLNHKKVRRLMGKAGVRAIYPKRFTSLANKTHKKYPYLLRDLKINRINQAWMVDITYMKIARGTLYLVCLIDSYSRKIMGWNLSPFLDTKGCLDAFHGAIKTATPEIVNSDQGCQFTSVEWINELEKHGIQISMDGKGRWADNIHIERFWRSVKYECLHLNAFETITDARKGISEYIKFYNSSRPHQALCYLTPNAFYAQEHVFFLAFTENIISKDFMNYEI